MDRRSFLGRSAGCWLAAYGGLAGFVREAHAGNVPMHEAMFYEQLDSKRVQCHLCPRLCTVAPDERGFCGARLNVDGRYYTMSYGRVASGEVDPIEKDPLYHVRPGISTFAIATGGCNMDCKFCQSWQIAQSHPDDCRYSYMTPDDVVQQALDEGCQAMCYTASEPINFIEFVMDVAKVARDKGLYNVAHSALLVNPDPLTKLLEWIDAMNVDLKGATPDFYQDVCNSPFEPVIAAIEQVRKSNTHLEITTLVIPTLNDTVEQIVGIASWIATTLGPDTPYHLTRFFPAYKLQNVPNTPKETLISLRKEAYRRSGLKYIYIGNVSEFANSTYCPKCAELLVERIGYKVLQQRIGRDQLCPRCGYKVPGYW